MKERKGKIVDNEALLDTLALRKRLVDLLLEGGTVFRDSVLQRLAGRGPIITKTGDTGVEKYGWKQKVLVTTEKGKDPENANFIIIHLVWLSNTKPMVVREIVTCGVGRAPGQLVFGRPGFGESVNSFYSRQPNVPQEELKSNLEEINGWLDKAFPKKLGRKLRPPTAPGYSSKP